MKGSSWLVGILLLCVCSVAVVGVYHGFLTPEKRLVRALGGLERGDDSDVARVMRVINGCADLARRQKLIEFAINDPNFSLLHKLGDHDVNVRKAAANALEMIGVDNMTPPQQATYYVSVGRFEDATKLGAPSVEPLIRRLGDENGSVREAAAEALGRTGDARAVESLIAMLRSEFLYAPFRQAAIEALGEIGQPAVKRLIVRLYDGDLSVRAGAIEALGKIGADNLTLPQQAVYYACAGQFDAAASIGSPSVEPLIARLDDGSEHVRHAAAEALGKIGDARAVEPLIAKLDDGNSDVREAAVGALGLIGDSRAVTSLITMLDYQLVSDAAIEALGKIGSPAVYPLIASLDERHSAFQSAAAIEALGKIGADNMTPPQQAVYYAYAGQFVDAAKLGSVAVEPLIAKLDDGDAYVRGAAAGALGEIGDARAVKPLIVKMDDERSYVCKAAAKALAKIGLPAVEPLIAKLDDGNLYVREAAAEALGEIGDARAVEPLIAKLDDGDLYVTEATTEALGKIGSLAVQPLIARLDDGNEYVRAASIEALGNIGDTRAVEPLIAKLDNGNGYVSRISAEALGKIGDSRAVDSLIQKLDSRYARAAAIEALGKIGTPAVYPLIASLDERHSAFQSAAAEALGKIGDARAVEPLIAKLDDGNSDVREAAAGALGGVGNSLAVQPLIAKLADSNSDVREAAAEALGEIGDSRAVTSLITMLDFRFVSGAAIEALGKIGVDNMTPPQQAAYYVCVREPDEAAKLGSVAVEPLIARLDDVNYIVRYTAAEALGKIGVDNMTIPQQAVYYAYAGQFVDAAKLGSRAVDTLLNACGKISPYIRPAALGVLQKLGADKMTPQQLATFKCLRHLVDETDDTPSLNELRSAFPSPQSRPQYINFLMASLGDVESANRLTDLQFDSLFYQAEKHPQMLESVLSAVSYSPKREHATKRVQHLCLAYIRRGDIHIIPQLETLLTRYGDKQLAEDYINCGQQDLDAAGRAWALAHGYSVGTGGGSARAHWGLTR